jgi:hypothetical protein
MKWKNLIQPLGVIWLMLFLVAVMVTPAAAQEPEEEDVAAQVVGFSAFLWNPALTFVSRGDGTVVQKLDIQGAEDISGLTLAIGYNSSVISPDEVRPGDFLPGTRGVDYFMTVNPGAPLGCGGNSSFTVTIAYFDPTVTLNGSGSLIEIVWRSDPDAAVGNFSIVCLDGATSQVVDSGGFPGPAVPNTAGTIGVVQPTIFTFQIGLEGGKNAGLVEDAVPDDIFTDVKINGIYPCQGGSVLSGGFCLFNNGSVPPPYTVAVNRRGYLDASASFADPKDSSSVFLLAGDLNNDNVVNILDIVLMASLLGSPIVPGLSSTVATAADFTGPPTGGPGTPPAPDGVINIIDLVLVAKNFGLSGPTDGTPPGGGFPF